MAKATPEVRTYMHTDLQEKQINHVTVNEKIYGHESAPMYEQSPNRLQSRVLEKRVFKTANKSSAAKSGKKRLYTAKSQINRSSNFGKSKYANPGDRPQLENVGKMNRN